MLGLRANGTAATQSSSAGTAVSVAKPSGWQVGDRAYALVAPNGAPSIADANGAAPWNLMGTVQSDSAMSMGLYTRVIDGTEGATVDFTLGTAQTWAFVVWTNTDVHATHQDVAPSYSAVVNALTQDSPSITTITAGAWHIVACQADIGSGSFTGVPSGYTLLVQTTASRDLIVYYKEIASPGATGAQTWTYSTTTSLRALSFAIRPSTGGGGGGPTRAPGLALRGVG